jgi:hypothetical protein
MLNNMEAFCHEFSHDCFYISKQRLVIKRLLVMWDSINGTLLPTSYGASSPYVNFGISPLMATPTMIPPVPYGGCGMGMGMFPGMMGGMPCDTFSSTGNHLPLHEKDHSTWGDVAKTTLKVAGGLLVAGLAWKFGKKLFKTRPKAK